MNGKIEIVRRKIKDVFKQILDDIYNYRIGIIAVIIYLLIMQYIFGTLCPITYLFGISCPGCGLTRAGIAFCKGDINTAWENNPAIFSWIIVIIFWFYQRYLLKKTQKGISFLLIGTSTITLFVYFYRLYNGTLPIVFQDSLINKIIMYRGGI